MIEKKVLINNINTNFTVAGEGAPILILHGWGGSSASWVDVQNKLSNSGYKVYCPDLPGFGNTKNPEHDWGVSDYVVWVEEFVKSQELNKFILIGHSFGGRISIKFSNYYPEQVDSLILCDSAGLKIRPSFKRMLVLMFVGFFKLIFGITFFQEMKKSLKDLLFFTISNTDYGRANEVMKGTMKRVIDEDLMIYLKDITVRTLIVWGK